MTLVLLWARRLWPFLVIALLCAAAGAGIVRFINARSLQLAHERTAVATAAAARADTIFRTDTVERRRIVVRYQAVRDTALIDLTDTAATKRALAAADAAIARSDSSIEKASQAISAHIVLEGALRTELAISERRRAPRFQVSSQFGLDIDGVTLLTGLEGSARVSEHWSIVGRIDKRWAPGEGNRRQLLARYSIGF